MALSTSEANLQTAPDQKLEGNNVKNLSDLPDDIIGHILSFMETRDAVRTSVLSKRWKYLREFSPTLAFDERRFSRIINKGTDLQKYVGNYIAKEIHLRSFVKTFCFETPSYMMLGAHLKYWITELVKRNVQDLYFNLNRGDERIELPDCLFNCQSLVRFEFDMGGIGLCCVPRRLPSTMCLSGLKTLSLGRVDFLEERSTNRFFSSCPVLEDLTLNSCRWSKDIKLVKICAPKLLRLTISEREYYYGYTNSARIAVFGPELTDFVYEGNFFNEPYLHNAKSLEKACIRLYIYAYAEVNDRLYRLLPCLVNVKDLELLGLDDNEVPKGVEGILNDIPMFKNLTRLKVHGGYFTGDSVLNANIVLMKLLNCSPRLEVLKVSWDFRLPQDQEEIDPMPPCFYSHLKIVEVEISDEKDSYSALKSLLRNALVLQKMVVSIIHYDSKKHNRWKRKILKLPRASQDCEVINVNYENDHVSI